MTDLLTAEELAQEWLDGPHPITDSTNTVVAALLERVASLKADLAHANNIRGDLAVALMVERRDAATKVDRLLAYRIEGSRETLDRLKSACEDLQYDLNEDWR